MNITKDFISSVSVNATAVKNGADLVKKKKYIKFITDKDQTFLSGECAGSGKNPYICSADFINATAPTFRCTCPSRQIPCKHVIGLMWAFSEGHSFTVMDLPEDILEKREKKEQRIAKAKEKIENAEKDTGDTKDSPVKEKSVAWKKSAVKKIDAQLTGITEAEKILQSIAQTGIGAIDSKTANNYLGIIKKLDSYFIPGIQNEFNDLLQKIQYIIKNTDTQPPYADIVKKLCQISLLLTKSKAYLEAKKDAPDKPDTESEIEELIGYAWKLEELAQHKLFEADAKLVQLCFHVRKEDEKSQYVDEGFFISLSTGKIYKTRNYRPFKAAKFLKEDDSVFAVLNIPRLYIYPSQSLNPRIRWESYVPDTFERISPQIYSQIKSYGCTNYADVVKSVKNQLKNLSLFAYPAVLVQFQKISKVSVPENDSGNNHETYAINDKSGNMICLKPSEYCQNNFIFMLEKLTQAESENNAMLLLFDNDIESGILFAQPLALITDKKIIRLLY